MSAAPVPPAAARAVFGDRLELAERFAGLLAGDAVERGLIGPRERDRLWMRHLLNCAVLSDLIPAGVRLVDVGSGAGLPGLPIAIRRPDLRVDLLEPMQRRVDFLGEAVTTLGLDDEVRVVRGRAEDRGAAALVGNADWVTARAVAPLDRLVRWCLPLLAPGGRLLALKGETAAAEAAEHEQAMKHSGAANVVVQRLGEAWLDEPTWAVVVQRDERSLRATRGRA
jgi:16S rRNA (guanine527-N7)-methyltransferase